MQELWKPISKFEGHYSVSSLGRVRRDAGGRSTTAGKILIGTIGNHGYQTVTLSRCNVPFLFLVHRLVLLAFRGKPKRGQEAAHNNGNKLKNQLTNLRRATPQENT